MSVSQGRSSRAGSTRGDSSPGALECRRGGLRATQGWLLERVMRPLEGTHELQASLRGDDTRWVKSGQGWSSSERVAVYQRAYFSRLLECLRDDYPAVEYAAGGEAFEALCVAFIEAHAPTSASLNFYGAPFADFCATSRDPLAPFLAELARLEWAMVECIHAEAERTLSPSALAELSEETWPRARLVPSPACRILTLSYPAHVYYRDFSRGEQPKPPAFEPCTVAVSRRGDDVWRLGIDPRLAELLRRLADSEPLAGALAAVALDADDTSRAELTRALSDWVSCGVFADVRVD